MSVNYENYKKRMEKVRRFLGVLYRFRVLIISVIALITTTVIALMATNGIVYGEVPPPPEITYGELLSYESNAFMRGVTYEYCEAGKEKDPAAWSSEVPRYAGVYSVRAVSTRTFGSPSYGKTYKFTIKPLEVSLDVADSVVYGERPDITGGLIFGDTITDFNYEYDAIDAESTTVYVDSIKAVSTDGVDVTGSYVFKTEPESILFLRREITVDITNKSKYYDGTPLSSSEYTVSAGSLADGDSITVECDGEVTEVGSVENIPSFTVMHGDTNVTIQYKITPHPGTLTIEPRPITVKTADDDWVYDGERHENKGYEIISELSVINGETVVVTNNVGIVDAGETDNILILSVQKEDESDSTGNYAITYEYGTLKVDRRTIGIKTESESWVYDGEDHSLSGFTIVNGELVSGEVSSVKRYAKIFDVDSVQNTVTPQVVKADGADSTDNYSFVLSEENTGLLTVTPRPITVKTKTSSRIYNGTEFTDDELEVTSSLKVAPCDKLVVSSAAGITDVGTTENVITVRLVKSDGGDSTANYTVEYDYGTLTVEKRPVTIETATNTWIYDGEFKSDATYTVTSDLKIAEGDRVVATNPASIRNVGYTDNTMTLEIVKSNGDDSTGNYVISTVEGTLTVTPCEVTIVTSSQEWLYDGEVHYNERITVTSERKISSFDTLTVTNHTEIKNAGSIDNELEIQILSPDGKDAKGNYIITIDLGTLTVTPIEVEVAADSLETMYDGEEHSVSAYTVKVGGVKKREGDLNLIGGDYMEVTMPVVSSTDVTDEDGIVAALSVKLCDKAGAELTYPEKDNYILTVEFGTLKINHRPISVLTYSHTWVYDGKAHYDDGFTVTSDIKIAANQTPSVVYKTEVKNAVEAIKNTLELDITDKLGASVIRNYFIIYSYGTLTVDKRPITLAADSDSKVYDGIELTASTVIYTAGIYDGVKLDTAFAEGEYLDSAAMTAGSKIIDVGSVPNVIDESSVVISDGNEDTTANYAITFIDGTLDISVRPITVTTSLNEWVYDGEYHYDESYTASCEYGEAIVSRDRAEVIDRTEIIDVGEKPNIFALSITTNTGESSENNYKVTYNYGTLTVTVRYITVETATSDAIYDGEPYYDLSYIYLSEYGITARDVATIIDYTILTDVGKAENKFLLSIKTHSGEPSDNNYHITYVYGCIEVTPRPITIKTATNEWVYDGQTHFDDGYEVTSILNVVPNERLVVTGKTGVLLYTPEPVPNEQRVQILKADGADSTGNYTISFDLGTLAIDRRPITITAASDSKAYDGTPLTCEKYVLAPGEYKGGVLSAALADNETITLSMTAASTITNAGKVKNEVDRDSIVIFNILKNEDRVNNYDITLIDGELEIRPLLVGVIANGGTKVYDGLPLEVNTFHILMESYDVYEENGVYPLVNGEYMVVKMPTFSITNVWESGMETYINFLNLYDSDGVALSADRWANYEIHEFRNNLTITPRPIKVKSGTRSFEYDGKEHTYEYISFTSELKLADGENYTIHDATAVIDHARDPVDNVLTITIEKADGSDSTENYDITYEYGTISITKRLVAFLTAENTFVYNGQWHFDEGYEVLINDPDVYRIFRRNSMPVADGETIVVTRHTEVKYVTSKPVDNILDFRIDKANGTDSTDNYTVVVFVATLTVTPRPITVTAGSDEKVYDGLPLICLDYVLKEGEDEGLADGDRIEIVTTESSSLIKVGSVDNVIDLNATKIYSGDTDVTSNYTFTTYDGTLTVTVRKITVTAGSSSKPYDGLPLTINDISTLLADGEEGEVGIASVDYAEFSMTAESTITDVGSVPNVIDRSTFRIYNEYVGEVTDCYEIEFFDGLLEVVQINIVITAGSAEKEYDGTPLTVGDYTVVIEGVTQPVSDRYYLADDGSYFTVIMPTYSATHVFETCATRVLGIEAYDSSGNRFKEEDEGMIAVLFVDGWLEIKPRNLSVDTADGQWVYDGTAHYELSYTVVNPEVLLPGDEIELVDYPTITEIGSVANAHSYQIINGEGIDVTQNYNIAFTHMGTLTVTAIPLLISTGSAQKVYDGTPLTCGDYYVDTVALIDGHTVHVTVYGEQTDLGSSDNLFEAVVTDGDGNDVSEMYEIIYQYGTLTVFDNEITVKTGSAEKVYDGAPLTCDEYSVEGLPDGYEIKLTVIGTITLVGSVYNNVDEENVVIFDLSTGENITYKFRINYEYGNLTVVGIVIKIKTASAEKEYDGTPLTAHEYEIVEGEPLPTDSLQVTFTGSQTYVGKSDNTIEYIVTNKYSGEDVTGMYDIQVECGTLTVTGDSGGDGDGELDGDLAGGGVPSNPVPVFTIDTEYVGHMYLRYLSYGNYDGKNWDNGISPYLDTDMSALYYGAEALKQSGAASYSTTVTIYEKDDGKLATKNFLLPYYALFGDMREEEKANKNDIYISSSYEQYTFTHYPYAYSNDDLPTGANIPEAYRSYVYANYLDVRQSTAQYLQENILNFNPTFTLSNPEVINHVASYVLTCAVYNDKYDRTIDAADDRVIAFIEAGEGVCRHYASLATLLYRMIGIPARYTIGYSVTSEGGEQLVKSDTGHAWVEVFLDGMGWVQIEVTPGGAGMGGGGGGDGKPKLSIKPVDISKEFDGTPLDASKGEQAVVGTDIESITLLQNLLSAGYTYEAHLSGSRTEIGIGFSEIKSFKLFNELGEDVTNQFNVVYNLGTIEITMPQIRISVLDLTKEYDGTPLKYDVSTSYYTVTKLPSAVSRVELDLSEMSVTKPQESIFVRDYYEDNKHVLRIYGEDGEELSADDFYVDIEGGLTVTKRKLIIKTASYEKVFDGEPLTAHDYELIGELLPTDILEVTVTGSRTEVGKSENTAEFTIKNRYSGEDLSDLYEIIVECGTLTVKEPSDDKDDNWDLDGDLAGGGPPANPSPVFTINTDYAGQMYFRYLSYGNFFGTNWDNSVAPYLDTDMSALYYGAEALRASGKTAYTTAVSIIKNGSGKPVTGNFLMPYYSLYDDMSDAQKANKNDIYIADSYEDYTFTHYPFTYNPRAVLNRIEIPSAYRTYVYEKYLDVFDSTGAYLKEHILDENPSFTVANPDVINLVAAYVMSIATYNDTYNKAIDDADDRVIAFIEAGEGVCRHYASLATLLYRMIGIPARYTIGYSVKSVGGEQVVTNKSGHAWVEVFIDGIGWVAVEVTPGGAGGSADKQDLFIKPVDINKEFDGTPLDASEGPQVIEGADAATKVLLNNLLSVGYTYEAHFSGSRTDYGVSPSIIESFTLFNERGDDVTNLFNIIYGEGEIEITTTQVQILVLSASKVYDGTPLKFNTSKRYFMVMQKPDVIVNTELDLSEMSVTKPQESITVKEYYKSHPEILHFYDANGEEISTENFYVNFEGGLTVTQRSITISAMSRQKAYDGEALTCPDSVISSGSLVSGHRYEAVITGSRVDKGVTENVIDEVTIYDAYGNDVTDCYLISVKSGTLTIT